MKGIKSFDGVSVDLESKCNIFPPVDSRGYVTQTGLPLSSSLSQGHYYANLAIVIDVDGQPVLGYVRNTEFISGAVKAEALIQSDIIDGDKDEVTWAGIPQEDGLELKVLKVHGYTINFK